MNFNVGDKVRVKRDLEVGKTYKGQIFNDSMCKYKGKKFTIATVKSSEYVLKEIPWYWTDDMLELVEEKRVIKNIIRFNENNCDNCKHYNNGMGLVFENPCYKCMDFDKWEEKEQTHIPKTESYTKIDKFKTLQEQELDMYILKNAKYGDSFGISVQKYGLISALTRMSDKWNRIENLILNHDNGTDDESLIDSLKDLSNYANMTVIELENENKPYL